MYINAVNFNHDRYNCYRDIRELLKPQARYYQANDDDEARDGGKDEHDGGRLDVVLAEHLHLGRPDHFHVNALSSCKKG